MNRQEFFDELESHVQVMCDELKVKVSIIDFGTLLRFHMDEIPGWFTGQYDVQVYRKQPSNETLVEELERFSEWFLQFPTQVKEYRRLKSKGELALLTEINRRYQKTWNTTKFHHSYSSYLTHSLIIQ